MNEKIAIVTGATSGVGLETARQLAERGYSVGIVARNPRKGADAIASIAKSANFPDGLVLFKCDMADLSQVRRAAVEIGARFPRIDVLVNNAGVINTKRRITKDGFEETFAVNHLAHFLLTGLLLPQLKAAAPSRIIVVSSNAHLVGKVDPDDLQSAGKRPGFGVYAASKLANLYFSYALARRLEGTGVTVNAMHPGAVASGFARNNGVLGNIAMTLVKPFFISPAKAAETATFLATDPGLAKVTGSYFYKSNAIKSSDRSHDTAIGERLWAESDKLTDYPYAETLLPQGLVSP